jgi:hypothetical protein
MARIFGHLGQPERIGPEGIFVIETDRIEHVAPDDG